MGPIRSLGRQLLAALLIVLVFVQVGSAQVRVRGYYRKDGTYVKPHYRSKPDGNFWNNWSTKGNVNPYTGRPGTKVTPPSRYGGRRSVPDGMYVNPHYRPKKTKVAIVRGRDNKLQVIEQGAAPPRTRHHLLSDSTRLEHHAQKRKELVALGVTEDLTSHSLTELIDMERRIRKSNELKILGVETSWRQHTLEDLIDMERRVGLSNELKALGFEVDWREHSYSELVEVVRRVQRATSSLRRAG